MDLTLRSADSFSAWMNAAAKPELANMLRFFCDEAGTEELAALRCFANDMRERHYGRKVYFRGLIEFSSYCKNGCYYCGLGRDNARAVRYRLSESQILGCYKKGAARGFRTFVLQSGEDPYWTDARLTALVSRIKTLYPHCAVTLSVGERSKASYKALFDAGADRYLLRHETADEHHYAQLHPAEMSLQNRIRCLYDLKDIGYQVGAGFMVDSPFQTYETLAQDLIFLRTLNPAMIGIGPFIPHKDTRFAAYCRPADHRTLVMLSLIRIMLPKVLLPATTALGTVHALGREKGLHAGANVVMPNLSPVAHRSDYAIYDNKRCTGEEAAECIDGLTQTIRAAGFEPDFSRGDAAQF